MKTIKLSNNFLIEITEKERKKLLNLVVVNDLIVSTCLIWDYQLIQGYKVNRIRFYLKIIKFKIFFRNWWRRII